MHAVETLVDLERKLAASNWKLAPLNLKIRGTKKLHVITKTGIFPKFQLCFYKKVSYRSVHSK